MKLSSWSRLFSLLRQRRIAWLVLLCFVALIAFVGFFSQTGAQESAGKRAPSGGPRPVPVATAFVRKGDINVYLNGLGTVTPRNVVTVRSRVDGQLMRVLFREGQMVKVGDLLAEIDPRPFQAQLVQAEGQLARDRALLQNAHRDLERYQTLIAQDSIARQQLDTQEALVRQYEGTVKMDQGQVDNARLQLVYARITAPIAGRIGLRQVDPGNIVHASDANGIVVITQLQPITVLFTLPEDSLPTVMQRLQVGQRPLVDAYDRDQKRKLSSGTLLTVDNQIDTTTGTIRVKAEFPNKDLALFPNQFVNARLLLETRRDATLVPSAAIQRGVQGTYVFVVKPDQTVSIRPVKIGPVEAETTAITEGLAPGEQVVTDGADKLREGAKVELPGKGATPGQKESGRPGAQPPRQRPPG